MNGIKTWQRIPKAALRATMAGVLGLALVGAANVRPAEAHHHWVGPAIAGLVIGGIVANEINRHHYRHYCGPYQYCGRRVRYRRHYRHYRHPYPVYPAPVVVVPLPLPFFVVPAW